MQKSLLINSSICFNSKIICSYLEPRRRLLKKFAVWEIENLHVCLILIWLLNSAIDIKLKGNLMRTWWASSFHVLPMFRMGLFKQPLARPLFKSNGISADRIFFILHLADSAAAGDARQSAYLNLFK